MESDALGDDDGDDGWFGWYDDDADLASARWYRVSQAWADVPRNYKPAGNAFICLRVVFWALLYALSDGSPLNGLTEQLLKLLQGLSRFTGMYDSSVWGRYGIGHIMGGVFAQLLPHLDGSKALRRRVNGEARDLLYKIYGKLRSSPDFVDTVPTADRPTVTTSTVPKPSGVSSDEHQPSSSCTKAAINQITCSRPRREGEGSKSIEQDTGLELAGPFGPHRVWFPRAWMDWSCFDTD